MRLLVDEDVDVRVIRALTREGHAVRRVPAGATNGAVIRLARREQRVLLTRDSDFTNLRLYPLAHSPGIVHIAIHPPWLENILPPVRRLLNSVPESEFLGRVFVLEATGYHQLP